MFESGQFLADILEVSDTAQIQPNGVDLRVEHVFEQTSQGEIARDGTSVGDRTPIDPIDGYFELNSGAYIVQYADRVVIPDGHIGFVYPRSSLLRNSCMLHTAVWDAGYEGRGEGLLIVYHPIQLETQARIAQLVLAEADHVGTYGGAYQDERLTDNSTSE